MTPRTMSAAGKDAASTGKTSAGKAAPPRDSIGEDGRTASADGTNGPSGPSDRTGGPPRRGDRTDGATGPAHGTEPDSRFTFANERTFLAWSRTALALIVAGLAISQLLPPFPGLPWGRHLLAVPLIGLGAILSVISYLDWGRNQRALSRGEPLPRSRLPRILAGSIAVMAIAAAVLVLASAALK